MARRMELLLGVALVAALGVAGCASRGQRPNPDEAEAAELRGGMRADPAGLFLAGLDTNLDGVVTSAEVKAAMGPLWASADENGDGHLSIIELMDWRTHWFGTSDGWPGRFFFDSDGNGTISHDEFEAGIQRIFAIYDTNHDGKIERSELLSRGPGMRGRGQREDGGFSPRRRPETNGGSEAPDGDSD